MLSPKEIRNLCSPKPSDFNNRCVYVYLDEENKVAYVGLTGNKEQRHKTHSTGVYDSNKKRVGSPVFEYFNKIGKPVPKPIYLCDNLSQEMAQEKEDYYVKFYKEKGYTLLNKGKTGIGTSSLGGVELWNKESVRLAASNCVSRDDFRRKYKGAYCYASKHNMLKELFGEGTLVVCRKKKGTHSRRWDEDSVRIEASKYKSRSEFHRKCSGAYEYAWRCGMLDELFGKSNVAIGRYMIWDEESVRKEASKYKSKSEMYKKSNSAYNYACINNMLDELFGKSNVYMIWNEELVRKEASKYDSRGKFSKGCSGAYYWAYRHKIIDELFKPSRWNEKLVRKEASKYNSRKNFFKGCSGAYYWAYNHKILDELFKY